MAGPKDRIAEDTHEDDKVEKLPGQQTALQKKTHTKTRAPHTKTKVEWPGQKTALPKTHTKTKNTHSLPKRTHTKRAAAVEK